MSGQMGYNENKAEKDLYALANLDSLSPSRVEIKIHNRDHQNTS
jgi:hypothetical protein